MLVCYGPECPERYLNLQVTVSGRAVKSEEAKGRAATSLSALMCCWTVTVAGQCTGWHCYVKNLSSPTAVFHKPK